jgi:hypothetical protein
MRIRTALSEDTTSAALNTKAHAPEHCAIDHTSLDVLGSAVARQVLIRTSAQHLALYTIAEHIDAAGRAAHVGTAGLARLADPTGEPPRHARGDGRDPVHRWRLTSNGAADRAAAGQGCDRWRSSHRTVARSRSAPTIRRPASSKRSHRAASPSGLGSRADSTPEARIGAGTSPRRRSRSSRFPGWARSSVPARPAEPSLTPSRSTARTTARQSSSAAGFPGTRRTTRSR